MTAQRLAALKRFLDGFEPFHVSRRCRDTGCTCQCAWCRDNPNHPPDRRS